MLWCVEDEGGCALAGLECVDQLLQAVRQVGGHLALDETDHRHVELLCGETALEQTVHERRLRDIGQHDVALGLFHREHGDAARGAAQGVEVTLHLNLGGEQRDTDVAEGMERFLQGTRVDAVGVDGEDLRGARAGSALGRSPVDLERGSRDGRGDQGTAAHADDDAADGL